MAKVSLCDVCKVYKGEVKAVKDFNLDIKDGEFVIFVGPSGCGKTTTLRMIAGLETITSGQVYIDDVLVNDLEPKERDIAMVFQNYALYPHMSIFDNLAYSLKCHHEKKEVINEKVHKVSKTLGIEEYLERKPKELSGGQRQRVALGRCLIRNPKVFLFDEPLSNLDAKLRVSMRSEISKLHKQVKGTFIYVTHDQTEAMTMADRIVVMKDGLVQQVDTPTNLYEHPANIFVATFLGSPQMNIFEAKLVDNNVILKDDEKTISLNLSRHTLNKLYDIKNENIYLGIRPNDFELASSNDFDFVVDKIDIIEKLGNETLIYFYLPGRKEYTLASLKLSMQDELQGPVYLKANKEKIHLFNKNEESLLKINNVNFIPVRIRESNGEYVINNSFTFNNLKEKLVRKLSEEKVYLSFKTTDLSLDGKGGDKYFFKVKVDSIDMYSDKKVYYAEYLDQEKNIFKITFESPKNTNIVEGEEVELFIDVSKISLFSVNKERISVTKKIHTSLIELGVRKIRSSYFLLTNDKLFSKQKYFIVEDIFEVNESKCILNVVNNKEEHYSFIVDKDDNYYVSMKMYIKYTKKM